MINVKYMYYMMTTPIITALACWMIWALLV